MRAETGVLHHGAALDSVLRVRKVVRGKKEDILMA